MELFLQRPGGSHRWPGTLSTTGHLVMTYTKSKDAGSFSMAFYKHIFYYYFPQESGSSRGQRLHY